MTVAPPNNPPVVAARNLPAVASRPLLLICAAVLVLLLAVSGRYGYHRDELYFLQAARHLAWGYPDQPPLTPAVAWLVDSVAPQSLVALRIAPALVAAAVVLLTGLLARELGGGRAEQLLAAACMAVSADLLITGHTLGTTSFDLLAWTAICWTAARILRGGDPRWWLALGGIVGLGLLNKSLVAVLPVALLVGLLISGPRAVLRTRWFPIGIGVALLLVAPNLWWQAANGWPQFTLSAAIAGGSSGTSESRWLLVPYQFVLVSPVLAPVWICGLVQVFRASELRRFRSFGWAYAVLLVTFLIAGGKPYYLAGMFPVLLAAGAPAVVGWLRRRGIVLRRAIVAVALVLSLAVNSVLMLPLVPVEELHETPIVDINYDAGETVGWPEFTSAVADVVTALPADDRAGLVILTSNYGEAGAIDRFGPALGLSSAYSGHNAFWEWGPPPDSSSGLVVAIGFSRGRLLQDFGSVEPGGMIDNGVDVDNEEQGATIWICRDQRAPWSEIWPTFRRLG
ncbi:MAG: glycosyltransferase family 39 protein [Nakamurella sp.]